MLMKLKPIVSFVIFVFNEWNEILEFIKNCKVVVYSELKTILINLIVEVSK